MSAVKVQFPVVVHIGHAFWIPKLLIMQHFYASRAVAFHIKYSIFLLAHFLFVEIIVHQDVRTAVVVEIGYLEHIHGITGAVSIPENILDRRGESVVLISETYHNLIHHTSIAIYHHLVRHAIAVHVFQEDAVRAIAAVVYGNYMISEIHPALVDGNSLASVPSIVDDSRCILRIKVEVTVPVNIIHQTFLVTESKIVFIPGFGKLELFKTDVISRIHTNPVEFTISIGIVIQFIEAVVVQVRHHFACVSGIDTKPRAAFLRFERVIPVIEYQVALIAL